MLAEGEVDRVLAVIAKESALIARVIELLDDADAKINIRVGVGAINEEYQGTTLLREYIPQLG